VYLYEALLNFSFAMSNSRPPRRAPEPYERLVPLFLVALLIAIVVLVIFVVIVLVVSAPR
jgi:hypothetical protein